MTAEKLIEFRSYKFHVEGDMAYHNGDLNKARELWTKGAEIGNKQCLKNLHTL